MTSVLSEPYFTDEQAAFDRLEVIVWPDGIVCPHCGVIGKARPLTGVKDKKGRERIGLKKCYACRKQFTVRVGTVFEASHVPLHLWFQAAYFLCSSKKGISSNQLHRTLGVTLKTAWFMSHRLREAMREGKLPGGLGGEGMFVEADETYVGGKAAAAGLGLPCGLRSFGRAPSRSRCHRDATEAARDTGAPEYSAYCRWAAWRGA